MDRLDVLTATTILGITTTLIHSGVSLAASQLVIPSIRHLSAADASSAFIPFYYRGANLVVPLAVVSGVSSSISAYLSPEKRYQYGAAAVFAIVSQPWTILLMMSTNTRLIEIGNKRGEEKFAGEAVQLLNKWQTLNAFRSAFAFVGGFIGLATYAGLL